MVCAKGTEPFTAQKIHGNVNGNWIGTPMQPLFDHYIKTYDEAKAKNLAGRAAGWLLMRVFLRSLLPKMGS